MSVASVAIVGGGISGLSAAYELSRLGVPFTLYERAPRAGGVIRTDHVDGYTIDAGPDALLTQKPAALDLCRSLGLGGRLQAQASRATFVVRGGRLRCLPEASVLGIPTRWMPFVTTGAFSLLGKLRMAADTVLPSGASATGADESIASFINRRFGAEAVDYLAEPLLAGIHGGDPTRLSMRCAFPRFLDLEARYRSVILGLQRLAAKMPPALPGASSPFVALPHGMTEFTEALIASLPAAALRQNAGVDGIERVANGFELRLDDGTRVGASAVLLATPPPATARLTPAVDSELAGLCAGTRMASVVTIALGYRRSAVSHPLNGTGFVAPRRERLGVRAVSWVSSKWSGRAPAGRVLLRAFLGGALDPRAIDLDDDALIGSAQDDVAKLLGVRGEPELVRVYRWRNATPQLEVGHLDVMEAIERRLAAHPGLFISASGFRGTGIADCVSDGQRQAALAAAFINGATTFQPSPVRPQAASVL